MHQQFNCKLLMPSLTMKNKYKIVKIAKINCAFIKHLTFIVKNKYIKVKVVKKLNTFIRHLCFILKIKPNFMIVYVVPIFFRYNRCFELWKIHPFYLFLVEKCESINLLKKFFFILSFFLRLDPREDKREVFFKLPI